MPCHEKRGFPTEDEAHQALSVFRNGGSNHRNKGKPQRVYLCPDCGQYHLTRETRQRTKVQLNSDRKRRSEVSREQNNRKYWRNFLNRFKL